MSSHGSLRRVAIVTGVRTPFSRAGTLYKSLSAIDLGRLCVAELMQRTNLTAADVDAWSVSRACACASASANQAIAGSSTGAGIQRCLACSTRASK